MRFTEIQLNTLQSLLKKRPCKTTVNVTLKLLFQKFSIGTIINRDIYLNHDDYKYIENLYFKATNCSYLQERNKNCDRVKKLETSVYEKAGGTAVKCELVTCGTTSKPIFLKNGPLYLGSFPGVVIQVNINQLDFSQLNHVIIVENLTMMEYLHEWFRLLPSEWQGALFIYRGDKGDATAVVQLVKQLPCNISVGYYGDYDFAGIITTKSFSKHRDIFFIHPSDWRKINASFKNNQLETFEKQLIRGYLEPENKILLTHFRHIRSNQVAFMQENFNHISGLRVELINKFHIH